MGRGLCLHGAQSSTDPSSRHVEDAQPMREGGFSWPLHWALRGQPVTAGDPPRGRTSHKN